MRIHSNYKDNYDYLTNQFGIDESIFYKRNQYIIETNQIFHYKENNYTFNQLNMNIPVSFWDIDYSVLNNIKKINSNPYHYANIFNEWNFGRSKTIKDNLVFNRNGLNISFSKLYFENFVYLIPTFSFENYHASYENALYKLHQTFNKEANERGLAFSNVCPKLDFFITNNQDFLRLCKIAKDVDVIESYEEDSLIKYIAKLFKNNNFPDGSEILNDFVIKVPNIYIDLDFFKLIESPFFLEKYTTIITNPQLKVLGANKFISNVEAYQNIYMTLMNMKSNEQTIIMDDKVMLNAKGFDNKSFKKDKRK